MAHTSSDGDDIISGINVTPLVDIVLVILIIFIVTAAFVFRNTIPLDLPQAASAESEAETSGLLNLAVTEDGTLYINGRPGSLDQLPQTVREARARLEGTGRKITAFISADVKADYGNFAAVVDRLRLEGVSDIALDTQPPELSLIGEAR